MNRDIAESETRSIAKVDLVRPPIFFSAILALAIALRMASFGDPTLHIDEEFYSLVGQRMLSGDLPYVDFWDRKPFGLFLIYAAIATVSKSVVAYQLAASISAGVTAFLLTRILRGRIDQLAQFGVAFLYLAMLPWLGGFGGQAPIFYSPLMAGAALLIIRSIPELERAEIGRRAYSAITLCGVALIVKQTVVAEAAFFGLFAVAVAMKSGLPWRQAVIHLAAFAAIGIAPFAIVAGFYAAAGHWPEFFQAMVTANLVKGDISGGFRLFGAQSIALPFLFPLALASAGLAIEPRSLFKTFVFGWFSTSVAALLIVPNFYWHYALPILLPVCVAAGLGFQHWRISIPAMSAFGLAGLWTCGSFDVSFHRNSAAQFEALIQDINNHAPRRTLLVYDGPVLAFAVADVRPLSRIVFPYHFKETIESGTTGRSAEQELSDVLKRHPSAVLFEPDGGTYGDNPVTREMVARYVRANCTLINQHLSFETMRPRPTNLYGDCD